jgi:hypothetical protein
MFQSVSNKPGQEHLSQLTIEYVVSEKREISAHHIALLTIAAMWECPKGTKII